MANSVIHSMPDGMNIANGSGFDANNFRNLTTYFVRSSGCANLPDEGLFTVFTSRSDNYGFQIAVGYSDANMYVRRSVDAGWQAWKKVAYVT